MMTGMLMFMGIILLGLILLMQQFEKVTEKLGTVNSGANSIAKSLDSVAMNLTYICSGVTPEGKPSYG